MDHRTKATMVQAARAFSVVASLKHAAVFSAVAVRAGHSGEEKISMKRHLAAILVADIAGYSRLMAEDEPAAERFFEEIKIFLGR